MNLHFLTVELCFNQAFDSHKQMNVPLLWKETSSPPFFLPFFLISSHSPDIVLQSDRECQSLLAQSVLTRNTLAQTSHSPMQKCFFFSSLLSSFILFHTA